MRIAPIRPTNLRHEVERGEAGLTLDKVSHRYGDKLVVNDVSLTIGPGELMCLLGPSGCGKTTTLRIAAGLEAPQLGSVWMGDGLVAGDGVFVPPEQRGVGFLFQDYALFPHLDVLGNVIFGLKGLSAEEKTARALEALRMVGMDNHAKSYPHTLSGGQQQRVGLARALAPRPRLMLLDEPFSGLDKRLRDQVRDETLHVLKAAGVSTLMVTHDPEEAMFMADTIALMRHGRIVQVGAPAELYCHPVNAFSARFFGEVNRLPGQVFHGIVETPFGQLDAPGYITGAEVEVLMRPEALSLSAVADGEDPPFWVQVIESRMLGRSSLVHLRTEGVDGSTLHLHARVPGRYLPPPDEVLAVTLDKAQVFLYPLDPDTEG